ncbi:MAG: peptide chain release factor 1 [Bacteroidia bacterium]|nr:peptide chain release factor 1 [Bacteroidia bacterium]MDW8158411.1 peptide chain release factor 1 [Bacteroidia bacterium]
MFQKLKELEKRFNQVKEELIDPNIISDIDKLASLSKEYKELNEIMEVYDEYKNINTSILNAKEILENEKDEEFKEIAKEELASLQKKLQLIEEKLKQLLIPKDPDDEKNVILEIRAGTGGDEACLFAGDLFRMYQRFAERNNMTVEVTSYHEGSQGGYKEIIANIRGKDCYGLFKFESGVHRVQRVPDTETQGRIHTSAATVAVLPEVEDFEIQIDEKDIIKETFCSSGPGGQSVNTTYSAVRLTHIPTGIVVSMQNERSQIKNYELAMKMLKSRLYDMELQRRQNETAALRKSLVSTGDRSAKIRTYNYPQSRVTDHRINLTLYNLPAILDGDLFELIEQLRLVEANHKLNEVPA